MESVVERGKKKREDGKEIRRIARCQRRTGERYRRLSGAVGRPVPKGAVCRLAGIVCEIPSIVFDESIEARRSRFRKSRYAGPGSLAALPGSCFFAIERIARRNPFLLNRSRDNYAPIPPPTDVLLTHFSPPSPRPLYTILYTKIFTLSNLFLRTFRPLYTKIFMLSNTYSCIRKSWKILILSVFFRIPHCLSFCIRKF